MSLSGGIPLPVEVEKSGSEFFTGRVMQLIPIRRLLFQFIEEPLLVRGREKGANGFADERGAVVKERLQRLNARRRVGETLKGEAQREDKQNGCRGVEKARSAIHGDGNGIRFSLMNR